MSGFVSFHPVFRLPVFQLCFRVVLILLIFHSQTDPARRASAAAGGGGGDRPAAGGGMTLTMTISVLAAMIMITLSGAEVGGASNVGTCGLLALPCRGAAVDVSFRLSRYDIACPESSGVTLISLNHILPLGLCLTQVVSLKVYLKPISTETVEKNPK